MTLAKRARAALMSECDRADQSMRKWVRVPVEYLRSVLTTQEPTEEQVEAAARILAQMEPGEDWPKNYGLGGGPCCGIRDEEFRDAMRDQARAVLRAAQEADQ